jgi:hypothetical protein
MDARRHSRAYSARETDARHEVSKLRTCARATTRTDPATGAATPARTCTTARAANSAGTCTTARAGTSGAVGEPPPAFESCRGRATFPEEVSAKRHGVGSRELNPPSARSSVDWPAYGPDRVAWRTRLRRSLSVLGRESRLAVPGPTPGGGCYDGTRRLRNRV